MNKEKKNPIHQPHDGLFKTMLRTPEVAKDFLKSRLEPAIFNALDLSTFKLENSSFIDEKLKQTHSDLVFSIKHKGLKQKCYIYFLVEQQTTYQKDMMMRVWEYNIKLMRQHIGKSGKPLPLIFNFILYTGQKPYAGARRLVSSFEDEKLFLRAIKRNIVIDLAREGDTKLAKADRAALLQLLLKYEQERDFCKLLDNKKLQFKALINKTPHHVSVFLYMLDREKHQPEVLLEKIGNLDPNKQDQIMSGLQRLINTGKREGITIGKMEGIKLGKMEGIKLGEQRGIKLGEEQGREHTISALIKKGIITKEQADKLIKEMQ